MMNERVSRLTYEKNVEYTTITTSAYCYNTFPKLLQARLSPVKEDFWELLCDEQHLSKFRYRKLII